ncbi:MAG: histidine phosphatase family protein [Chrysiogenetes bacterium]|nr:histidine phosphatase family protein [Chrysiogenetes bacterium]
MEFRAHRLDNFDTINALFNQETEGSLSDRGRDEARAVARHFSGKRLDAIYASPLLRAKETADATAEVLGMDVAVREEITELRTGRLPEGSAAQRILSGISGSPLPKPVKRVMLGGSLIPLYFQSWRSGRTEGGESPADLEARITRMFEELQAAHGEDAHVALFAHGYLIFYLSSIWAQRSLNTLRPFVQPYIPNGSITTMEVSAHPRPRLIEYAAARHL